MDTGNILQEMATCDFSAPLSVKIMYDDSDEEFNDDIITIPEQDFSENSSLHVKTQRDTVNIVLNENVQERPNSANGTSNNVKKVDKSKSPRKGVTEKKVVKRKGSAETEVKNKKLVKDGINNGKTQENIYLPHNVIISYSKDIIDNNTDNDKFKTVNKQSKKASDYIDDLILSVSESLINIIGSYYKLADMIKLKKMNPLEVEDLKKQYKRIKYHFFQLSYCTIVTIILDFQKHASFSEDFLDNTIQIARERTNVNYTTQQIKPFYDEMLTWAKMKRSWLHNLHLNNIYQAQEADLPTLRQHLSEPSQQAPKVINDNRSSQPNEITSVAAPNHYQNNQTCSSFDVLTHVTPNSSVSRVSHPLDSSRFKLVTSNPNTNYPPTQIMNHTNHVPNFYSTIHHPNIPSNNIQYQNYTETNHWQIEYIQNRNRYLHQMSQQGQYMPHLKHCHGDNCLPSYDDTLKCLTSGKVVGSQNPSNLPVVAPQNNISHAVSQHNVLQAVPKNNVPQVVPQRNVPQAVPQHNVLQTVPQNNVSQTVPQNNVSQTVSQHDVPIDTTRSSVSTDSGFMSPLQFNYDSTVAEEQQMTTPLITDVTSLNPAALQIIPGSCYVCGVSTKKMCLGCYQTYYCSYICQRSHWGSHKNLCKQRKESRVK